MLKVLKKLFVFSGIIWLIISCSPTTELVTSFNCDASQIIEYELEKVNDFNNNFSITVPKHWNTKLYYDTKQSEIFSADTIKNLSDSYIMDFSSVNSKITIDSQLLKKIEQKIIESDLNTVRHSFHKFQDYDALAHLSRGKSRGLDLYVFQYYIKVEEERYMLIKTEYYGEENFDTRFCESLNFIEKIRIK